MDTVTQASRRWLAPASASLHGHDTVTLAQAMGLLAIVGDLSMGQPIDASERAARLAERIALSAGCDAAAGAHARMVAQLRWSGCTANAAGFAALLGDDVGGRHAMLGRTLTAQQAARLADITPLAEIHCEVSGDIAAMMGLPAPVEHGLRHVFEQYDGGGLPFGLKYGLQGDAVPAVVYHVALAGDIEILARVHGVNAALAMIARLGDVKYPAALVAQVVPQAQAWLEGLDAGEEPVKRHDFLPLSVPLTLVADMIELKLPWLAGYSRRVALLVQGAAQLAGLPEAEERSLARAALLHGIGRAAVPNAVWERKGKLGDADWEAIRLVPYWTARAGSRIDGSRADGLAADAQLASHVYERLDGSGYFRSLDAGTLGMPQRLLAAAAAYIALRSPRPWRAAHEQASTLALLEAQVTGGRLDRAAVDAVLAAAAGRAAPAATAPARALLSAREIDVLQRISLGETNKQAARAMRISPSTVRTHVESIFRKLGCSTRAAATLRALTLGLI